MATIIDTLVTRLTFATNTAPLRRLDARVQALRTRLNSLSTTAMIAGGAAAGGLLSVVASGIKTDKSFRSLMAVTGASEKELKSFKEQAYEVGSKLPLMTSEIIDAQVELAKFGLSLEQVKTLTPSIANVTVAVGGDLATIALQASQLMSTYEITADKIGGVMDKMVKAGTITPASFQEIGDAIGASAESAKMAGISIEDYIAILGNLKASGLEVSAASQGLNMMLTQLSRVRAEGINARGAEMIKQMLGAVGMGVDEMKTIMDQEQGFLKLLGEIYQRAPDSAVLTSVFAQLGGTTYGAGFSSLARLHEEAMRDSNALLNAEGEAARHAQTQMEGLSGAWTAFKSMLDTVLNVLSDVANRTNGITDAFKSMSAAMEELLRQDKEGNRVHDTLLNLIAATLKWGTGLLLLGFILRGVSMALGAFSFLLKAATVIGNVYRAVVAQMALANVGLSASLAKVTLAQIKASVAMLFSPIGLIIAGIAALVVGIAAAVIWWDELTDAMKRAWNWITELWVKAEKGEFGFWIMLAVRTATLAFKMLTAIMSATWDAIKLVWETAPAFFRWALGGISDAFDWLGDVVSGALDWIWDKLKAFGSFLFESLLDRFPILRAAFAALQQEWGGAIDFMTEKWAEFMGFMAGWGDKIKKYMFSWMPSWMRYLFGISDSMLEFTPDSKREQAEEREIETKEKLTLTEVEIADQEAKLREAKESWLNAIQAKETPEKIAELEQRMVVQQEVVTSARAEFDPAYEAWEDATIQANIARRREMEANLSTEELGIELDETLFRDQRGSRMNEMRPVAFDRHENLMDPSRFMGEGFFQMPEVVNRLSSRFEEGLIALRQIPVPQSPANIEPGAEPPAPIDIRPIGELIANLGQGASAAEMPLVLIAGKSPETVQEPIRQQESILNQFDGDRSIAIGDIHVDVNAQGGDAKEIAEGISIELKNELQAVVESADSKIAL